jgi:acyl-CoA thioester hydrolase
MKPKSVTKTRVRYAETDKMGVVYHANYYLYMEIGRTDYLRKRGKKYSDIENMGYYMFVTETNCKHYIPAKFEDELIIETYLEEIKGASFYYHYLIKNIDGDLLAEGFTKHAFTDHDGKPVRMPKDIKELFTKNID